MRLALLTVESDALDLEALQAQGLVAASPVVRQESEPSPGADAPLPRFFPKTAEEVVDVLAAAAAEGAPLFLRGGGTRLHWANPMGSVDAALSLSKLSGVIEFEPDEGVLKAKAGTTIAEVQAAAAAEGWELPLDPPSPGTSTVGGTIASAVTGPRAHALGSVSDAILGLDLVSAEGIPSKCGGRVVKNVTGYDLAKLHCGAFGTLGVMTSAWLRLKPSPEKMKTLDTRLPATAEGFALCQKIAKQKSVRACVWEQGPKDDEARLVIEWGGSPEGVAFDSKEAQTALSAPSLGEGDPSLVDALRDRRAERGEGDEVILRARVLGTRAFEMARQLRGAGLGTFVDVGLGVVHARGRLAHPDSLLELRREAVHASGHLFAESMPKAWRGEIDVFGTPKESAVLMNGLKERFDPRAILNPGRFVMGASADAL